MSFIPRWIHERFAEIFNKMLESEEQGHLQYKIPEDAEYGTFVEQGKYPHPLDDSKGYFYSGFVPMRELEVEVDPGPVPRMPISTQQMFLVGEDYIKNYERMDKKEIGVDMAKGKDVGVTMVVVEKAYLEWAGVMAEECGRLKGFWNELASYMFDHLDMDGGTFQDLGVKHGLLIEAAYNPEIHGDIDTEVGDTIFINALQEDDSATADDKD